jgi:diguanylate cyclase (GGDEF)-like protein
MPTERNDPEHAAAEPLDEYLFNYLRDLIYSPAKASLDLDRLPPGLQMTGKALLYFAECLTELTVFAKSLAKGELNGKMPSRSNEIAAPLKALHANLRHLTWQTQQVAKGDYKQRVSFMGDFSDSFNAMIEQLDQRRDALLQEIESNIKKSKALSQNNSLLEAITENISQWITVVDRASGEWLYSNRDVGAVIGDTGDELQLQKWLRQWLTDSQAGRRQLVTELELPHGGDAQFFSVVIHPLHWYEHDAVAFIFTDVSSEKKQLHKLQNVAYHDPLTKAFNRHYGMEILTEWLGKDESFVICFVDIDNLKFVNDKYGHTEGDKYILRVVASLRDFSSDAVVCRLGGDEFMLLAKDMEESEAEDRLETLRDRLIAHSETQGQEFVYTNSMSYGVVKVGDAGAMSASELLGIADEKMYRYKRNHKKTRQNAPS